jgi:MFS family permease
MGFSAQSFNARFWFLIGATFLGFLGIGTVLPGLAPHIRHDLGGSDQTVGFVIGIFSFVALAARFISGPLADRRGRKITILLGLASCGLAGGAYLLPLGISGAYLGRVLQGFGEACLYTGAAAWAVELGGIHRGAQALGYLSSGIWGGISAGPVVGQWLGSFQHAALFQLTAAALALGLLSQVGEDYVPARHVERKAWIPKRLIAPGVSVGLVNVHYPVIAGFLILHLAKHGNSGPAAFSAYALLILLSRFFLGGLPDRMAPAITFYGGLIAMAVGLILLALATAPPVANRRGRRSGTVRVRDQRRENGRVGAATGSLTFPRG